MSEYQSYEFRAVDRPLNAGQMRALRNISTRATITPTSFRNTYEWGNLKANPRVLLEKYFDAFVHVDNSGGRWCMLRLPSRHVDLKAIRAYQAKHIFFVHAKGAHVVLEFSSEKETKDDWAEEMAGDEGLMPSLIEIRNQIFRGDFSALYLAWLVGLQMKTTARRGKEPPLPAGLAKLSSAMDLARFMGLHDDLLAAARQDAARLSTALKPTRASLKAWIRGMPAKKKDDYLLRLVQGDDLNLLEAELRRRFEIDHKTCPRSSRTAQRPRKPGRTAKKSKKT